MKIFLSVTACSLIGMVLGGLFGWFSGTMIPDFFERLVPWDTAEPIGLATFLGATAGVLLGGGLGCFGVVVQILTGREKGA